MRNTLVVFTTLIALGARADYINNGLEHWLHLCEQPRLEYWNKLCAGAFDVEPQSSAKASPTAISKGGPVQQLINGRERGTQH